MTHDTEEAEKSDMESLTAAVGAVIFAAGEPLHPKEIAAAFEDVEREQVERAIELLREHFAASPAGLVIENVAGGVRLATRPGVAEWVRRFFRQRNRTRLSPAALETLAIVAYRQPVTAPEIQAIRGKDPSASLKSLLEKKMVKILGKKQVVGNPLLYGTTKEFLVHFGLDRLKDLPSIEEFDEIIGAFGDSQGGLFEAGDGARTEVDDEAGAAEEAAGTQGEPAVRADDAGLRETDVDDPEAVAAFEFDVLDEPDDGGRRDDA